MQSIVKAVKKSGILNIRSNCRIHLKHCMNEFTVQGPDTLSVLLQAYRKEARMTQSEAARRLGINQQAFSALERNPGSVSTERVLKLLNVLGVEVVVRAKTEGPKGVSTFPVGPAW
jgi:HTH-type transcriptional regulator/antitoxin HipB